MSAATGAALRLVQLRVADSHDARRQLPAFRRDDPPRGGQPDAIQLREFIGEHVCPVERPAFRVEGVNDEMMRQVFALARGQRGENAE